MRVVATPALCHRPRKTGLVMLVMLVPLLARRPLRHAEAAPEKSQTYFLPPHDTPHLSTSFARTGKVRTHVRTKRGKQTRTKRRQSADKARTKRGQTADKRADECADKVRTKCGQSADKRVDKVWTKCGQCADNVRTECAQSAEKCCSAHCPHFVHTFARTLSAQRPHFVRALSPDVSALRLCIDVCGQTWSGLE